MRSSYFVRIARAVAVAIKNRSDGALGAHYLEVIASC
jgi:hypothetical protein